MWEFNFRPQRISNTFQFEWLSLGYGLPMMLYHLYCIANGLRFETLIEMETNYVRWAAYAISFPFQIIQFNFVSGGTEINAGLAIAALALSHVLLFTLYDVEVVRESEEAFFIKPEVGTDKLAYTPNPNEAKKALIASHQKHANVFIGILGFIPWLLIWYILFRNAVQLHKEGIVHEEWIVVSIGAVMVLSCLPFFNLILLRDSSTLLSKISFFKCIESEDPFDKALKRKLMRERCFQFIVFASQMIQSFIIYIGTKENSTVLAGLKVKPFKNLGCLYE